MVLQLESENVDALVGLGDLYDRQNVDELALNNYEQKSSYNYIDNVLKIYTDTCIIAKLSLNLSSGLMQTFS